jgi:ABC-2 type transport system ATP-binding protein
MLIMGEGRIVASGTSEELQHMMASNSQVVAEIAAPAAELQECWATMAEIEHYNVSASDGEFHRCALTPHNGTDLRPLIFQLARDRGWQLRELTRSRHSLEDIYLQLTTQEEE